jgi:iron complex transport system substrate-binding protein
MADAQRIVSLISSATEILFGVGADAELVAVSHECDFPAAAQKLPRATRSLIDSSQSSGEIDKQVAERSHDGIALYELDAELIRELRPDLIVTQAQCDVCAVRYADVVGLVRSDHLLSETKVVALNPLSIDDVLSDIRRIGEATGRVSRATAFEQSLQLRVKAIREQTQSLALADRPRVACIEWVEPLMLAANWTPQLIDFAGGQSGLAVAGQHSSYSSWNDLLEYDPEVLLISPCGFDLERSKLESKFLFSKVGWKDITAVKESRSWVIDGNAYLNRSGPPLIDSLEILAHLIQPRLFGGPDWCDQASLPWANVDLLDR